MHYPSFPVRLPYLRPLLPKYLRELHRKHTTLSLGFLLDPLPQVGWGTSEELCLFINTVLYGSSPHKAIRMSKGGDRESKEGMRRKKKREKDVQARSSQKAALLVCKGA